MDRESKPRRWPNGAARYECWYSCGSSPPRSRAHIYSPNLLRLTFFLQGNTRLRGGCFCLICGPADETRILMVQPTTRTPGEASRKWIRPALEHVGDQLAEDWRKLKGVPTVACANNQAWVLGVVVN